MYKSTSWGETRDNVCNKCWGVKFPLLSGFFNLVGVLNWVSYRYEWVLNDKDNRIVGVYQHFLFLLKKRERNLENIWIQ